MFEVIIDALILSVLITGFFVVIVKISNIEKLLFDSKEDKNDC